MPFVHANDLSMYYEIEGSGPFLILVTGFAQNSLWWKPLIPKLSQHFTTVIFDLRGSGQTESPNENYSVQLFVKDLVALMDALEISSAHFMGVSMGTLIIQKLCIDYPDRVKKVVLCAPFAILPEIAKNTIRSQVKLLEKGVERKDLIQLNASWLLSNTFLKTSGNLDRFIDMMLDDPYPQPLEGLLGQVDALLEADLSQDICRIPHHVLLLIGKEDIDTPPSCAKDIASQIKNCNSHTFKDVGHLFLYEIPDKVSKKVLQFLLEKDSLSFPIK